MGLYDQIDNGIMYGINAGVKAWNWTTGGTKGDLEGLLFISGSALYAAGSITRMPTILVVGCSLFHAAVSFYGGLVAKKFEEKERNALENSMKDLDAEVYKQKSGVAAPIFAFGGTGLYISPISKDTEFLHIMGSSLGLFGLAMYVARTDYLPPKKNVLSRVADKFEKLVEGSGKTPAKGSIPSFSYDIICVWRN